MRRISWLGAVVAMAFVLGGCGKPTHESLAKDVLAKMQEIADVLKDVKDESSAKAAPAKIKRIGEDMRKIRKEAQKLPKPTKEPNPELEKELLAEMTKIQREIANEVSRIGMDPKVMGLFHPILDAVNSLDRID